jgi:hypothetical protein
MYSINFPLKATRVLTTALKAGKYEFPKFPFAVIQSPRFKEEKLFYFIQPFRKSLMTK